MKLTTCSTALFVKDINLSKNFYTSVLGLEIDLDFGKNVIFKAGFAIWEIQEQHIIPVSMGLEHIQNQSSNRFELYFETEDLPEIYNVLKKHEVIFLHDIHEESWGQNTIRFFDPDHHLIEIGESMKQFVTRFYKQGLTIEQISERTSVHVHEVKRIICYAIIQIPWFRK